jgi:hypothetical protein
MADDRCPQGCVEGLLGWAGAPTSRPHDPAIRCTDPWHQTGTPPQDGDEIETAFKAVLRIIDGAQYDSAAIHALADIRDALREATSRAEQAEAALGEIESLLAYVVDGTGHHPNVWLALKQTRHALSRTSSPDTPETEDA